MIDEQVSSEINHQLADDQKAINVILLSEIKSGENITIDVNQIVNYV